MLAWDPSPSEKACPAEFGYNLYRGEKSNNYSPEPVNKGLIKEPTYTDTSVITGKTYYYVVKAKCGTTESEPSNEMKVDVPLQTKKQNNARQEYQLKKTKRDEINRENVHT